MLFKNVIQSDSAITFTDLLMHIKTVQETHEHTWNHDIVPIVWQTICRRENAPENVHKQNYDYHM